MSGVGIRQSFCFVRIVIFNYFGKRDISLTLILPPPSSLSKASTIGLSASIQVRCCVQVGERYAGSCGGVQHDLAHGPVVRAIVSVVIAIVCGWNITTHDHSLLGGSPSSSGRSSSSMWAASGGSIGLRSAGSQCQVDSIGDHLVKVRRGG